MKQSLKNSNGIERMALECRAVTMQYGQVTALREVSIAFRAGQIHAVLGQNGAGKSTFSSICSGVLRPTSGEVLVDGVVLTSGSVDSARHAGIEIVHQSFALPPSFTVAEALEFGSTRQGKAFSKRGLERHWKGHLDRLGMKVDMRARIGALPVETRQAIEIARALSSEPRVLILDEPTAVLSPEGANALFDRLRVLRDQGVTILLVLHKIREVLSVAETVSVLRAGQLIQPPTPVSQTTSQSLVSAIVGMKAIEQGSGIEVNDIVATDARRVDTQKLALELRGIRAKGPTQARSLADVDLVVKRGEIVGIAGVEGNGQDTLVEVIAGLSASERGSIAVDGRDVTHASLANRRACGLRIIPFDRNREGLSLSSSLWENWVARRLVQSRLTSGIRPLRLQAEASASFRQWDVRFASAAQRARELSGGNAQKVILARELDADSTLLIAAQPTRGLDVGASGLVWDALRACSNAGNGVLLISSDLDELFDICDRVVVMLSGCTVETFSPPYNIDHVGAAMTGARHHPEP